MIEARLTRLEKKLASFSGADQYAKKVIDGQKKVEKAYRDEEAKTEAHVSRLNKLLSKIVSPVDKLTTALRGGTLRGSDGKTLSEGFLPGLSNVVQILSGIPQVGSLIGSLVSPLTQAIETGVEFNAFLETTALAFEQVDGSAEKARARIESFQKFAAKTPFQFEDVVQGAQLLNAFGFSLDEVIPKMTQWGNVLAKSGQLSADALNGVVLAMGQMKSKGKVQMEEVLQLVERKFPFLELLSKAIGKTTAETTKLISQGKVRSTEAIDAVTAMIAQDARYRGMMDKLSTTLTGRLSNAQDIKQQALGRATQGLSKELSDTLGIALEQGGLVEKLSASFDSVLTPAGGVVKIAAKTLLGGGLIEGISEGIGLGKSLLASKLEELALDTIVGTVKTALDINSPAKTMIPVGQAVAEGIGVGFEQEMIEGVIPRVESLLDLMVQRATQRARGRNRTAEFIEQHAADAVEAARRTGVPASVTLAQAILESGSGASGLTQRANNYFGIKGRGPAGSVTMPTREEDRSGRSYYVNAPFRAYNSAAESFVDHALLLLNRRFGGALAVAHDPAAYARELQRRGYASDHGYAEKLIGLINRYDLGRFDRGDATGTLGAGADAAVRLGTSLNRAADAADAYWSRLAQGQRRGLNPYGATGPAETQTIEGGDVDGGSSFARADEEVYTLYGSVTQLAGVMDLVLKPIQEIPDYLLTADERMQQLGESTENWYKKVVGGTSYWKDSIKQVRSLFESSFQGAFQHIDEGWRGFVGSFVQTFLQGLEEMAAAALAKQTSGMLGKVFGMLVGAIFGGFGGAQISSARINSEQGFANFFGTKLASGGYVEGPGTSISDSIPAWLSNGEGVINADATAWYGGAQFIDALNSRKWPKFSDGGMLMPYGVSRPSRRDYQSSFGGGRATATRGGGDTIIHLTQNFPVTRQVADLAPAPLRRQGQMAADGVRRSLRKGLAPE